MAKASAIGLVAVGLCSLVIAGCGSISTKSLEQRNQLKYAVLSKPSFVSCRHAINQAYRDMTRLKVHTQHHTTYADWSAMNEMLADSLSYMTDEKYSKCVITANQVETYIHQNINYEKWKKKLG